MFRKKPDPEPELIAEWVTATPGLVETWPIMPAAKMFPQWIKNSSARVPKSAVKAQQAPHPPGCRCPEEIKYPFPRPQDEAATIRTCPGIVDVLRMGYVLRSWADIEVLTTNPPNGHGGAPDGFQSFTGMQQGDLGSVLGSFGTLLNQQFPVWEGEYNFALKFDSPWECKLPDGWSLLYLDLPYHEKKPWRVVPGIVDGDQYHQVNMIAMWDHQGSYLIEAGTPLCILVPVRRDGLQMKAKVHYDPERFRILRAMGKASPGDGSYRMINGSYQKERIRRQKAAESASDTL